jgi:hypothetical protein
MHACQFGKSLPAASPAREARLPCRKIVLPNTAKHDAFSGWSAKLLLLDCA